uniref:Uncharacterized protein n=1 Tax=Arundo donax TaxID=35708 RepID=A0A0A9B9W0_ARUDO
MNHVQFSFDSDSNIAHTTGCIQLLPSKAIAEAK